MPDVIKPEDFLLAGRKTCSHLSLFFHEEKAVIHDALTGEEIRVTFQGSYDFLLFRIL
jgi:hypothetical protein